MEHFDPCLPPLPQTGSTGGNVLFILLSIGALILALTAFRTKSHKPAAALGLLVIMGGAAATLSLTPVSALADGKPENCPTATPIAPATVSPPTVASTVSPATPAPTVAPTIAPPVITRGINGTIKIDGTIVKVTSKLGSYPNPPKPSTLFPEISKLTDPNSDWELPTFTRIFRNPMANAALKVFGSGPDNVLGTGDDVLIQTLASDATGSFTTTGNLPAGRYRVMAEKPVDPDLRSTWTWTKNSCPIHYKEIDPSSLIQDQGNKFVSASFFDVTLSDQQPLASVDFLLENGYTLSATCILEP